MVKNGKPPGKGKQGQPCPDLPCLNSEKMSPSQLASALGKLGKGRPKTMSPAALAARRKGAGNSARARSERARAARLLASKNCSGVKSAPVPAAVLSDRGNGPAQNRATRG